MSKVDAMRALREARHAAASTGTAGAAPRAAARAAAPAPRRTELARPAAAAAEEALCGHRNLGGRSCTREPDHVKNGTKSHRYG